TPPRFTVFGARKQNVIKQDGRVIVYARCSDEACSLEGSGTTSIPGGAAGARAYKLLKARRNRDARQAAKLRLKVPSKTLQLVRRALQRGQNVTAKVKVVALDQAGNSTAHSRKITFKAS